MNQLHIYDPANNFPSRPNTKQIIDLWFAKATKGQDERNRKERRRVLDLFCATFGRMFPDELKSQEVYLWVDAHKEWASDWTIMRVYNTLKAPLNWAFRHGFVQANPLRALTHPQGQRGRPLEDWEYRELLRHTDACFGRFIMALRYSGMRPGELSDLQWPSVHLDAGAIILTKHKTVRKTRQPRIIPIHPAFRRLLQWIRRKAPEAAYVFLNSKGQKWTRGSLALRIGRLRKKTKLAPDAKLYGLRHGLATTLLENGVDLKVVSAILGHTTTRMTEYYVHLGRKIEPLSEAILKAFPDGKKGPA